MAVSWPAAASKPCRKR